MKERYWLAGLIARNGHDRNDGKPAGVLTAKWASSDPQEICK